MSLRAQPPLRRAQRGAALLLLAAMLVLGGTWLIVSALNAARRDSAAMFTASGDALRQAKAGLLGYMAVQAGKSSSCPSTSNCELYPGRLPCPEVASPTAATEGTASSYCSLPAVGRLPWRTLGMDKLTDAAGEPLWYVVSPGFNRASAGVTLTINSNTSAQLSLDGNANAAVALIIAPGAPLDVQAASGCSARNQTRSQTFPLNYLDYLECGNADGDSAFVTTGPSTSFNDQVIAITHADLFNVVEPAVAKRIETDIVPSMNSVYASAPWSATASAPLFPYAAAFGNPDASSYTGSVGTYQGLIPLTYSTQPGSSTACISGTSDPRCNPNLVTWKIGTASSLKFTAPLPITNTNRWSVFSTYPSMSVPASNPYITITEVDNSPNGVPQTTRATLSELDCTSSTSNQIKCKVTYGRSCNSNPPTCSAVYTVQPRVRLTVRAQNVAKAFKAFDTNAISSGLFQARSTATSYGASPLGMLRNDGDADITTEWLLPSADCINYACTSTTILIPINLIIDHTLLSSTDPYAGWFISNEWYKQTYYAISTGNAPGASGTCVPGGTPACLTINDPSGNATKSAILILAGRNLGTNARPSSLLADYFEGANADGTDTVFDRKPRSSTFNDRLLSLYPYP